MYCMGFSNFGSGGRGFVEKDGGVEVGLGTVKTKTLYPSRSGFSGLQGVLSPTGLVSVSLESTSPACQSKQNS